MNPSTVLREAIKAVPSLKFALGVAALGAVVAIVLGFKVRPEIAIFGALIVLGLMFVLVVFSRFAGQADNSAFVAPAMLLAWFYTLAVIIATTLCMTSYFLHRPLDFRPYPNGSTPSTGSILVISNSPAVLKVNGVEIARTEGNEPVRDNVPAGMNIVRAESPDGKRIWEKPVSVIAGGETVVMPSLGKSEPAVPGPTGATPEPSRKPPAQKSGPIEQKNPCQRYREALDLATRGQIIASETEYNSALQSWDENNVGCDRAYIYKDYGYALLQDKNYLNAFYNFVAALQDPGLPGGQTRDDTAVYRGLKVALINLGEAPPTAVGDLPNNANNGCQHYELAKYLNPMSPALTTTAATIRSRANIKELQNANIKELNNATEHWSSHCGDERFVFKDLGCAYAGRRDPRALQFLNQAPPNDKGADGCRRLLK
jgi:hypothetical protein